MLKHSTPVIDDSELIIGKPNYRQLEENEREEFNTYRDIVSKAMLIARGQTSHMAINHEMLLKYGISGMKKMIDDYRNNLKTEFPEDMEKDEFYKACQIVLDGVSNYSERYADYNDIRETLYAGGNTLQIENVAIKNGMQTIIMDGISKALEGLTILDEIHRIIYFHNL